MFLLSRTTPAIPPVPRLNLHFPDGISLEPNGEGLRKLLAGNAGIPTRQQPCGLIS